MIVGRSRESRHDVVTIDLTSSLAWMTGSPKWPGEAIALRLEPVPSLFQMPPPEQPIRPAEHALGRAVPPSGDADVGARREAARWRPRPAHERRRSAAPELCGETSAGGVR